MRKDYPDKCTRCGQVMPDDQLAFRIGRSAGKLPNRWGGYLPEFLCLDCAAEHYPYLLDALPGNPCWACKRPLVVRARTNNHVCSNRCMAKVRRDSMLDDIPCLHCGKMFTPTRSDAKFCSGKCRIAAYRARV